MKKLLAVAAALVAAGCASGGIAGYERGVVGGGGGLPETVARASQDVVTPPGRRMLGLGVRTWVRAPDGTITETPGACRIEAGAFGAEMATPGRLVIPDLGPDAPTIVATCTSGALAGSNAVEPAFGWAGNGGSAPERVAWGGGWWWGGVRTGPMRYPDLDVGLQPR